MNPINTVNIPKIEKNAPLSFKSGYSVLKINNIEKQDFLVDDATAWINAIKGKLDITRITPDKKTKTIIVDEGNQITSTITMLKNPKMIQLIKINEATGSELTQNIRPTSPQERAAHREVNELIKKIFIKFSQKKFQKKSNFFL